MGNPRDPRYAPRPSIPTLSAQPPRPPVRPAPVERQHRAKPNPNPMRLMFGLLGIASVSALTAAMVPSITPAPVDAADPSTVDAAAAGVPAVEAVAPVRHVTRYVTLQPGQTPPPGAVVQDQPNPTPILKTQIVQPQATPRPSGSPAPGSPASRDHDDRPRDGGRRPGDDGRAGLRPHHRCR